MGLWNPFRKKRTCVKFDEQTIVCHYSNGRTEAIRWTDLREVSIRTTDDGPFVDDLFWILKSAAADCIVPSEAVGVQELLIRLQQLPGFDHQAVIRAATTTEDATFLCWQKPDATSQS